MFKRILSFFSMSLLLLCLIAVMQSYNARAEVTSVESSVYKTAINTDSAVIKSTPGEVAGVLFTLDDYVAAEAIYILNGADDEGTAMLKLVPTSYDSIIGLYQCNFVTANAIRCATAIYLYNQCTGTLSATVIYK